MKMIDSNGRKSSGYFLIITMIMLMLLNGLVRERVYAQEKALQKALKGVQLFWDAKFDEAIDALRAEINSDTLNQDELSSAYLYLGFSLVRQSAQAEAIDKIFRQAIRANPQMKLDAFKTPPDLLNRFEQIRKEMTGSVYITSNPTGAEVIGYSKGKEIKFQGKTPVLFKDLLVENYDMLLSKKDYQERKRIFKLSSAVVDTFNISLSLIERPFYKKWWTWAGGGAVIASVVTMVAINESPKSRPMPLSDLPMPPDHPR